MIEHKLIYTPEVKQMVKKEIIETIYRICTGNSETCAFGFCMFNKKCAKPHFEMELLPDKKLKLKALLKNVRSKERKKNGLPAPVQISKRKQAREGFHQSIKDILGQSIFDHELVKGCEKTTHKINSCSSLIGIIEVLQERHKEKYGRKKLFGYRKLYAMYSMENNPDFKPPERPKKKITTIVKMNKIEGVANSWIIKKGW